MPNHNEATKELHPVLAFFLSEWRVLKKLSFYVAVGIIAVPIAWFWKVHYEGILQEKDATIARITEERDGANRRKEELSKEVDGLRIYRQPDLPLKKRCSLLARQINEFTKDWKSTDGINEVDQNVERYLTRFGLRAQIIRDDLDQLGIHSDEFDHVIFNFGRNYKDIKAIADQAEKLSDKLPD